MKHIDRDCACKEMRYMSTTKRFVTSGIMVLFALALTLLYIPDGIVTLYEESESDLLIPELIAFAVNGIMCIGAWMLAVKASYNGARMVRLIAVIKQWMGWLGLAGGALLLFLGTEMPEMTEYPELNYMTVSIYILYLLAAACIVIDIFIARNISKMMKDIMYRMSGGRPYGYLVTLDNWSVAGLVVSALMAAVTLSSFIAVHRLFSRYGISISNLKELGLETGSVIGAICISAAQVFAYIVFIKLSRGFCAFTERDNAEKDAADNGEDIDTEAGTGV